MNPMMLSSPKQKLVLVLGIAAVAILIFTVLVVPYVAHRGKIGVKITVLPYDSTLLVDNVKTSAGKVYLEPGKHTLKATRKEFTDVTKSIDTAKLNTKETIYMMPKPNSDAAFKYLENHPEQQRQREAAASDIVAKEQEQLSKYPFLSELPYYGAGFEFTIDYDTKTDDNGNITLLFTVESVDDSAKADAQQWFKNRGLNPNTLNITYTTTIIRDNPAVDHQ